MAEDARTIAVKRRDEDRRGKKYRNRRIKASSVVRRKRMLPRRGPEQRQRQTQMQRHSKPNERAPKRLPLRIEPSEEPPNRPPGCLLLRRCNPWRALRIPIRGKDSSAPSSWRN